MSSLQSVLDNCPQLTFEKFGKAIALIGKLEERAQSLHDRECEAATSFGGDTDAVGTCKSTYLRLPVDNDVLSYATARCDQPTGYLYLD